MLRQAIPAILLVLAGGQIHALKALSINLRCEIHFFEAHFNFPPGYDKKKDEWLMAEPQTPSVPGSAQTRPWIMTEEMHKVFTRAPLSAYAYFTKILSETWHMTMLKPQRHEYPFLKRYELTYLEARLTSHGQALYRFEQKVGHLRSMEFTLDTLEPQGIFIQHAATHDQFLHLTCVPE